MFLSTIKPLMRGASSITLTISAAPDGALRVLLQPALEAMDRDTSDQTLADLQMVLSSPYRVIIPADADADAAFAEVFSGVAQAREQTIDQLAQYRERMAEAANQARLAQEKKSAPKAPDPKKVEGKKAATSAGKSQPAHGAGPKPDEAPPPAATDASPATLEAVDASGVGEPAASLFA